MKTFVRIVKTRSTEEFESLPYICTLLNSCLWTYYGVTKPGAILVATVNAFGTVVEIVYILLFLVFATPHKRGRTWVGVIVLNVGFFGGALVVTNLVLQGEKKISGIGFLCAAFNIVMYASPLSAMKTVVRKKSVEYMPFLLSFALLINGGIWALYGLLVHDWFIGIPNGTGFVLGVIQLVLYAMYRNNNGSVLLPSSCYEESSQTTSLLA